jgi:hypothetical protein
MGGGAASLAGGEVVRLPALAYGPPGCTAQLPALQVPPRVAAPRRRTRPPQLHRSVPLLCLPGACARAATSCSGPLARARSAPRRLGTAPARAAARMLRPVALHRAGSRCRPRALPSCRQLTPAPLPARLLGHPLLAQAGRGEREEWPVFKDRAEKSVPPVRKRRKSNKGGTEREEGELGFPKDLYVNSENCRDLSVK